MRFWRDKSSDEAQPVNYLISRAAENPNGLLFDDGTNAVTNKMALEFVMKLAAYFKELGVKRGDIVGLNMPSSLYIYFLLATWCQNGVATNYTKQIAQNTLWKPEWVFSTVDFESSYGKRVQIVTQSTLEHIKSLDPQDEAKPYASSTDPIALIFSSGTTGTPKAFLLSTANLEARTPIYSDPPYEYLGSLVLLDIGNAVGIRSFYGELRNNGCYLVPGDVKSNVKNLIRHNTRSILGSPIQITELFSAIRKSREVKLQLETVIVTGSTLPVSSATQIKQFFGCEIVNAYGSQEAGLVSIRRGESTDPFDLGRVVSGVQVEIVNHQDEMLPIGITGRIRCKSNAITLGYFRDSEITQNFFIDSWFYSGDLGYFDKKSHLFLDGRESELINAGGVKVDPSKIDDFVIGKFGVIDAGTFSFSRAVGSEEIGIALVVSEHFQEKLLIQSLIEFFGTNFPIHVYIVDKVIRNDGGKVMRSELGTRYLGSTPSPNID